MSCRMKSSQSVRRSVLKTLETPDRVWICFMEAGDVAVEQDATQVTVDHVDQARESLERSRIVDGVAGLTQQDISYCTLS